jgi:hypothetical protein
MNENKDIHDSIKILLNIIYEYVDITEESSFLSVIENKVFLISVGFRMMIHIFQLNCIHTKNMEEVYLNCQRAYYYYLEYLEQMHTTNMCQDLNHIDAILFVYKKTLIKYDNDSTNSIPTDIVSSPTSQNNNDINQKFIKKMSKITKLLNTLFWWENPHDIRQNIEYDLVLHLLQKHYENETYEIQEILEENQKTICSLDEYTYILKNLG